MKKNKFNLSEADVNPVRRPFRVLAGFIFVLALVAFFGTIASLVVGGWDWRVIAILVAPTLMGWIAFKVMKTGYPPKLLLWTSSEKNKES